MATLKDLFDYPNSAGTNYFDATYYGALVNATDIESGKSYYIESVGTTDFTAIGAASNSEDLYFTATGTGSGSGTAYLADTGMLKKMLDLRGSAYKAHNVSYYATTDHTEQFQETSKYVQRFEDNKHASEMSVYDLWYNELPVFNKTSYNVTITGQEVDVDSSGEAVTSVKHAAASHISSSGVADADTQVLQLLGETGPIYLNPVTTTHTQFYRDALKTQPMRGDGYALGNAVFQSKPSDHAMIFLDGGGPRMFFKSNDNPFENFDDTFDNGSVILHDDDVSGTGAVLTHSSAKYVSGDSGSDDTVTMNINKRYNGSSSEKFYATKADYTDSASAVRRTLKFHTDTAKTTLATQTEEYIGKLTFQVSNSGGSTLTYNLSSVSVADGNSANYEGDNITDSMANLRTYLQAICNTNHGTAYARLYISASSGYSNSASYSNITETTINTTDLWFISYNNTTEILSVSKKFQDSVGTTSSHQAGFNLAASGSATIFIHIIDPATFDTSTTGTLGAHLTNFSPKFNRSGSLGIGHTLPGLSTGNKEFAQRASGITTLDKWTVTGSTVIWQGNRVFSYKDTNNATAYGAKLGTTYYKAGDTTKRTATGNEVPTLNPTVNGSGYITAYTHGTLANKNGGIWSDGDDIVIVPEALADTYSPRAATTVETAEIFDTQDYWIDAGNNQNKDWPTHVSPSSVKLTYNMPGTVNISQSGKKFVRSSGITKWQIEAQYPPMSFTQFEQFQKVALAVQGQAIPFQFAFNYGSIGILFYNPSLQENTDMVLVDDVAVGGRILTLGGLATTDTLRNGEVIILSQDGLNGDLATIVSGNTPNAFGEVKVRLSHAVTSASTFGHFMFRNPSHATVTLGEDAFEYSVDTANKYYITVKFDLDEFK